MSCFSMTAGIAGDPDLSTDERLRRLEQLKSEAEELSGASGDAKEPRGVQREMKALAKARRVADAGG